MRALKLWNGRPYGVLPCGMWADTHVCVCAYSVADARRLCVEAGYKDPGVSEIRNYWSPCWGDQMKGVVPERGLWVIRGHSTNCVPVKLS